ncbi:MAG TPA: DUF2992 domain-containing protein [Clostridium sp.]|nr:DUF2992 domain-containing protein [Clostridium sp.]
MNTCKLTVLYNEPFWIGIFEVEEGECYKASKVTFGAEPKDTEVYEFLLKNYYRLNFVSIESDKDENKLKKKENPKRLQKKIHKEVQDKGIGTKAQIALKKQHEENKIERKKRTKEEKKAEEERLYKIKQQKKKEKHKGH